MTAGPDAEATGGFRRVTESRITDWCRCQQLLEQEQLDQWWQEQLAQSLRLVRWWQLAQSLQLDRWWQLAQSSLEQRLGQLGSSQLVHVLREQLGWSLQVE